MVTGISLQLHLLSHEHSREHDSDECPICRQLLIAPAKFLPELETSQPDTEQHKEDFEFVSEFYMTAFHHKSFTARPPPASLEH